MSGGGTGRLLLILMGVIPLIVLVTVVAAFFLVRAGFGLLLGAGVPFVVATVAVLVLSVMLGKAAGGAREPQDEEPEKEERRSRGRDSV